MKRAFTVASLALSTLLALPHLASADVKPHVLFTDGAVLQRDTPVPVWGTADDGEKVTVKFQGQEVSTTAKDGKWFVKLAELKAGGPSTLTIEGKNKVEVVDVLVGEVWICSGQSNMEWTLNKAAEIATATESGKANDPMLRLYTVPKAVSDEPLDTIKRNESPGQRAWLTSDAESAARFSAVGYFFGRDLRKALNVPVGLIHTSWGGTASEAWTSKKTLESDPDFKTLLEDYQKTLARYPAALEKFNADKASYRERVAQAKAEGKTPPPAPREPTGPKSPHPAGLYNAMIAPLVPYAIRGAIWYQGEANAGRAFQYRTLFPAMIKDWRQTWGGGDFPFLLVQLAPYQKIVDQPGESAWAELREAQLIATHVLPKVGMAVITDVGEENDIHPKKKEPVGGRLALAARAIAYGENIVGSGPEYIGNSVKGNKVTLRFKNVGQGLVAKDGPLTGFAIAGEDHKFVKADAEVAGDAVVVYSDQVEKPVAVRFGWANYPVVNLWNKEGLPATPFRTDDFPMVTGPKPARKAEPAGAK
jgi:sialate O-acetylesterase